MVGICTLGHPEVHHGGYMSSSYYILGIPWWVYSPPTTPWVHHGGYMPPYLYHPGYTTVHTPSMHHSRHSEQWIRCPRGRALGSNLGITLGESLLSLSGPSRV